MIQQIHFWAYARIEGRDLNRYLYTYVHSSIIHDGQKIKATKVPINKGLVHKMWREHVREYHSALKGEAFLTHATM